MSGNGHARAPAQAVKPIGNLPQLPPYNGHPILYHLIDINATLDSQINSSCCGAPDVSIQATNIEQYYPQLAAMYEQGYKMLVFVSLPGSTKHYGYCSSGKSQMTVKFQGIFRKMLPEEIGQEWDLKVEQSTMVKQMFMQWSGNLFINAGTHTGSMTDTNHIFQTLNNISQCGGRLISVELTGMEGQLMKMQQEHIAEIPEMEVAVDVFYEVPRQPSSEKYVYQVVSCPMQSTFHRSCLGGGKYHSVINWEAIMTQYLGTGWKLVEIVEDYFVSSMCRIRRLIPTLTRNKNCLWIFEKPVSRMNDDRPYYEGTMVEHSFKTKWKSHAMGFGGISVNVTTKLEPVIEHFGRHGWQVVRLLETPDVTYKGSFQITSYTPQMIFFQRLIAGMSDVTDMLSGQPQMIPPQTQPGGAGAMDAPACIQ